MSDKDPIVMPSAQDDVHLPGRLWAFDDYTDVEDRPADLATGLTSLRFIGAAVRRSAWLWCAIAVAGMVAGFGVYASFPPTYQASTSLFVEPRPGEDPGVSSMDDQAVAQSRTVAGLTMRRLGLRQNVSSLAASYTVTIVTPDVLLITVGAPSSSDAVSRARGLATEFLRFRAGTLETGQNAILGSLDQQISQAKQHIQSLTAQIGQLSGQAGSPAQQARRSNLEAERNQATHILTVLEQVTYNNQAISQRNITAAIQGSKVLDAAAPLPPASRKKHLVEYVGLGLLAGLALGVGIVVVRALVSDRLRRRDDVAHALGAPVKLSVGTVRLGRWLPGRQGLAAARSNNVQRIVGYLDSAVPSSRRGPASLAVVPADDVRVPAVCLASLAVSCAEKGLRVVVADLCGGAPAARLLGATDPGIHEVSVHGAHLVVAVPERDDVVPVRPLGRRSRRAGASEPLATACASADLLLTLAALDPSLGGDHLAGWARCAVVVVTAGQSSTARINAVGEMIRLAGMPLVSGVLVGADKTDESLGVTNRLGADRDDEVAEESMHSDAESFFVKVDGSPGEGQSRDR